MNTGHAKARTFDPSTHLIAPYPQGSFRLYDDNSYHYKEMYEYNIIEHYETF